MDGTPIPDEKMTLDAKLASSSAVPRVAVIGLGVTGLAAVKNFREIGLDVEGFDQNDHIGGLWQWSRRANATTVLKSTRANVTRQKSCYQDFPFPDDVPNYPSAHQIVDYLKAYVKHFDLEPHFRLGYTVQRVERTPEGDRWALTLLDPSGHVVTKEFDKILVATGPLNTPFSPELPGRTEFRGQTLHAQAYKDADDYIGKKVVVVGLSNTGGDIAVDLAKAGATVFLSYRSGGRVIKRTPEGEVPRENRVSRRMLRLGIWFYQNAPQLSGRLSSMAVERMMRKSTPGYQTSWNLLPAGPISNSTPVINDVVLARFRDGSIVPKPGIKRLLAPSRIEFADGTTLDDVDAIIFATGYQADYSIFVGDADPTAFDTSAWDRSPHSNGLQYPRLYQGMFSTVYPDSLALIGPFRGHSVAVFNNADLSTAAVGQVFAGRFALPPKPEMEAWCDRNYVHNCKRIAQWRVAKPEGGDVLAFEHWLNEATGNGVNAHLGWGWTGWKFWWTQHRLYRLLVDGIDTPHLYRLFPGERAGVRKPWEGARAAIEKANGK